MLPESQDRNERSLVGRLTPRRFHRFRFCSGVVVLLLTLTLWYGANFNGVQEIVLAPGLLSNPHAQLWQGNNRANSCMHCHPALAPSQEAPESSALATTNGTVSPSKSIHSGMSQQQACAVCHERDLDHLLRGTPHDLTMDALVSIGSSNRNNAGKAKLVSQQVDSPIDWKERSFQCSDCHREHQGRNANLSAMSDSSCQACHQSRFHSFDNDHSEFTSYPTAAQNAAIAFNHRSHASKHFSKHQEKFDCNVCHIQSDAAGTRLVKITSFEQACSRCHQQPLTSSLSDGVVLWQIPNINLEQIDAPELRSWPEMASSVTDLEWSPLMRKLIIAELESASNDVAKMAAVRLRTIDNLSDLEGDGEETDAMIAQIAIASKSLLQDIAANGQHAIETRLRSGDDTTAHSQFESRLVAELLKGIPPNIFDEAYREWFTAGQASLDQKSESNSTSSDAPSPFLPSLMPPQEIPSTTDGALFTSTNEDDEELLSGDDELIDSSSAIGEKMMEADPSSSAEAMSHIPKDYDSRVHLVHGGWMIDRLRNAIVYVPNGHADRWMQAYAEWISQDSMKPSGVVAGQSVIARCLECHIKPTTRNSLPDQYQTLVAAWRADSVDPSAKKLTRFDHQPHLTLPQLRDCESCHRMNESPSSIPTLVSSSEAQASVNLETHRALSSHDFEFMSKKMCIKCHNAETKVQNCTLCHDYHVGKTFEASNASLKPHP